MIKDIRHTGIVVFDLDRSMHFYMEKLGFKVLKRMNESGSFTDQILGLENIEVTTVKMVIKNNQMIELLDFSMNNKVMKEKNINDIGPTHLAFTVDDVEKMYSDFVDDGIEFISEPKISPDGYAKVAFCKAPEGTFIELVELLSVKS